MTTLLGEIALSPSKAVGVPQQHHRLIEESRHFHLVSQSNMTALLGEKPHPPVRRLVCKSNMTALLGEAAFLFQVMSAIPQLRQAISTAVYRP